MRYAIGATWTAILLVILGTGFLAVYYLTQFILWAKVVIETAVGM